MNLILDLVFKKQVARRISHPLSGKEHHPRQERELRMLHIEMLAIARMRAEQNKWRGFE